MQRFLSFAWLVVLVPSLALGAPPSRSVVSLDGTWQIEQGSLDGPPASFAHTIRVPGLVDMATPAFAEVGQKSARRQAFWYRRTFTLTEDAPPVALLLIHKARYGTKVWLNGQLVGEHLPCFTPVTFDVARHLKPGGQENTLLIRLGADRESVPAGEPSGWDFEKYRFTPGIYDSVELILTHPPYIRNVQTVPDIASGRVRVVAEIISGGRSGTVPIQAQVVETRSGRLAGSAQSPVELTAVGATKADFSVPIDACHLWTPDDPFLYTLKLSTDADTVDVRFGMRTFGFDPATKRAMLNGKPYYLRGTNVCIDRFFEDGERGQRPWDKAWVRRLHEKFKGMHWNAIRYCIGFPPDFWYDIADEEGFLIQDEFPIWLLGGAPEKPVAAKIIPEYTEWMRHRWNHPCVVIWDAQNESFTDQTGLALSAVRKLDLSNRPWENGWGEPQADTDCVEAHPYVFIKAWEKKAPIGLRDLEKLSGKPSLQAPQRKRDVPIIINEYAWLWLNRDGSPTCLTKNVYASLLGENSTTEQRRYTYARLLAAKTEFWRCHRECAGVMHFCGLGYSRPSDKPRPEGGATSDLFTDLEKLTFESNFERYVKEAFNPVGLMLDYWGAPLPPGSETAFSITVINDLQAPFAGPVTLDLVQDGRTITSATGRCNLEPYGRQIIRMQLALPAKLTGRLMLSAHVDTPTGTVHSLRDLPGPKAP